ncbi:MAG: hypothetical protein WAN51_04775 [Alphaproteobacteria bacterium]
MGLFSWLRGKPAPKKPAPAAPANKAGAKKAGESRDELIRKAAQIHAEKRKEFDNLDPAVREKLLRQAMGKKDPDAV